MANEARVKDFLFRNKPPYICEYCGDPIESVKDLSVPKMLKDPRPFHFGCWTSLSTKNHKAIMRGDEPIIEEKELA